MPGSAARLFLHTSIAISLILIIVIIIIIIFTIIAISVIIVFVFILHWKTLWSLCLFCSFRISWHMLFSYLALLWPSVVVCHLPHQHFGIFAYFARLWNPDTGYLYIWPCWDHQWRVIVHISIFFVAMCIVVFLYMCLYSYSYLYMYIFGLVTISSVSLSTSTYSLFRLTETPFLPQSYLFELFLECCYFTLLLHLNWLLAVVENLKVHFLKGKFVVVFFHPLQMLS